MSSYDVLAGCYDRLTYDVDYSAWADYVEQQFAKHPLPGNTILDLACGTGSLTRELGVIPIEPIFLCQSMEKLDLYGTIDACVCCLDSVNYVTDPKKLARAFARVHLFLMPGGLFLFDINTPEKLEGLDGQVFLDETEDTYCVWRTEFSRRSRICSYFMDIFQLDGATGQWKRGEELHRERAYSVEELTAMLEDAGFRAIKTFGELKTRPPRPKEQRVFFTARKEI